MASSIGHISEVDGDFFVRAKDGVVSELKTGDQVHLGDTLFGDRGNSSYDSLFVTLDEGPAVGVLLVGDESQCLDASLSSQPFSEDETIVDVRSLSTFIEVFIDAGPDGPEVVTPEVSSEDAQEKLTSPATEEADSVIEQEESVQEESAQEPIDQEGRPEKSLDKEALARSLEEVDDMAVAAYVSARMANDAATTVNETAAAIFGLDDPMLSRSLRESQEDAAKAGAKAMAAADEAREAADRLEALTYGVMELLPESISRANMAANSAENAAINAANASVHEQLTQEALQVFLTQSTQDAADAANIAARQTQEAAIIANNCAAILLERDDDAALEEARISQVMAALRASNAASAAAVAESVADWAEHLEVSAGVLRNARNAADNAESASTNAKHAAEDSKTLIETITADKEVSEDEAPDAELRVETSLDDAQGLEVTETSKPDTGDDAKHQAKRLIALTERQDAPSDEEGREILISDTEDLVAGRDAYTIAIGLHRLKEDVALLAPLHLIRQYGGTRLQMHLAIYPDGRVYYAETGLDDKEQPLARQVISEKSIDLDTAKGIMVVKEEGTLMVLVDGTLLFAEGGMPHFLEEAEETKTLIGERGSLGEGDITIRRLTLFTKALSMIEIASMVSSDGLPESMELDIMFDEESPITDRSGNGHDAYLSDPSSIIDQIARSSADLSGALEGL